MLNFKTDSKEPSTAGDYCKVQTALALVQTQYPGGAIQTPDRLPTALPSEQTAPPWTALALPYIRVRAP